jgi:hypothetical protein
VAACDPAFSESGYQDFVGQCSAALANQPTAEGASANPSSDPVAANCERFASNRDAEQACRTVISPDDFKKTAAGVCMQNSITTNPRRIEILENAFGGGDPIPALTLTPKAPIRVDAAPQVFQGGGRGDPIPSITQPSYVPLRHGTPFLPSTEPASAVVQPANTPLLRNGPSPAQIFRNDGCPPSMTPDGHGGCSGVSTVQPGGTAVPRPSASSTTASGGKSGGCPQYTIPDGHGGCSGSDTVQRGGNAVPRSSTSGGISSTTTGVRKIDTNARTSILRSGGTNAAKPFPTPTIPSVSNNSAVLRRGSGAANAVRNQQFTPGLH